MAIKYPAMRSYPDDASVTQESQGAKACTVGTAVRIRQKESRDAAACVQLLLDVHHADGYPRYLPTDPAGFVTPRHETTSWVAEQDAAIVGHIALHESPVDPTLPAAQRATGLPPEGLAVVARLLVDPTIRRAGVGRELLATATQHAAAQRQRCVLDVVRDAHAAIAFYEAAGWQRLEPLTLTFEGRAALDLWVYLGPA